MASEPCVGLIGCGYWGKNLLRVFHELGALSMVSDVSEDSLAAVQKQYPELKVTRNCEEVLASPQIQAVCIASPAVTHFTLVSRALSLGKDVFVEKPLALSVADGERLVRQVEETGRILMVDHVLQYHSAIIRLKQLIAQGELGKILYIYSNRLNIGKLRTEENILWSFAPHDISVILGLVGESPVRVQAFGESYLQQHVFDTTLTVLSFKDRLKAHIFVNWLHPFKEQKLVVVGDRQMAVFDDMSADKLLLYSHRVDWINRMPVANKAEGRPVALDKTEPLKEACSHFLDCVRTRKSPRTDAREALAVLRVLNSAQGALETDGTSPREYAVAAEPVSAAGPAAGSYFVHPTACVDHDVSVGPGTKIWHYSHILGGTRIGAGCNLGQNVVVGPDVTVGNNVKIQNNVSVYKGVTLEDDVFCGPSCVFTNVFNPRSAVVRKHEYRGTRVRRGATIGANATIVCGVTLGVCSFIGAGAVVTRDVPDYALVLGNPARRSGWMCECGVKLQFQNGGAECAACHRRYVLTGETVTLQPS